MLPFGVVSSWPRSLQYGLRALIALAILLPLLFVTSNIGDGSDTVTDAGPTTSVSVDPATTLPPNTQLTLPPGSALPPTLPPGAADPNASTTASSAAATQPKNAAPAGTGTSGMFESIRNNGKPEFSRYASVPSDQLDLNALTVAVDRADNGSGNGEGQFRTNCEYSHFSYDDPIVFPGQPGKSHLHMFIGNTKADAYTTQESLLNTGGSTCDGFELNRSAYWVPALMDGKGHVVAPQAITIYYKTKKPDTAVALPQGLKMVVGNTRNESFNADQRLNWSCGGSGSSYNETNRIPDCNGDYINATIQFPNCWDGKNLDSPDHLSHMAWAGDREPCPATHPNPIPQISILLYWAGVDSVDGWYLSSDKTSGFNSGPGASLHADWFGGWNKEITDIWTDNCIRAVRNCSAGQTGTSRMLAPISPLQQYEGPQLLPLPAGAGPGL